MEAKTHVRPIALAAFLAWLAAPLAADDIIGTVRDTRGEALAFTGIEACRDGDRDACERTVSDRRGRYSFSDLAAGRYTLSVPGRTGAQQITLNGTERVELRVR